jgi:hypothetical protein
MTFSCDPAYLSVQRDHYGYASIRRPITGVSQCIELGHPLDGGNLEDA